MDNSHLSSHLGSQSESLYEGYSNEFSVSQSALAAKHKIPRTLRKLQNVYRELRSIQQEQSLTEDSILLAFRKGLKFVCKVEGEQLLEKGKELFELCQILAFEFDQYEESLGYEKKLEERLEQKKAAPKKQGKKEEQILEKLFQQEQENLFEKVEKKQFEKVEKKVEEQIQKTVKKENRPKLKQKEQKEQKAMNKDKAVEKQNFQQNKVGNPQKKREKKQIEKNLESQDKPDEEDQKIKSIVSQILVNESSADILADLNQLSDISFPIVWEHKYGIKISDRVARKESQTKYYQKICAKQSFKMGSTYRIRFRVKQYGTMAIGLVTSQYKNEKYIDDRKKLTALKYIAFENGGGKIMICGQERANGYYVGLQNGTKLEMVFDSAAMKVTFVSDKLGSYPIDLPGEFKDYPLYLFLEMKQQGTCIEFY